MASGAAVADVSSTIANAEIHEIEMPSAISISHHSDVSPFLLKPQDVEVLAQSEGFNILRHHLAEHYTYSFCAEHSSTLEDDLQRWLIVRDVLHALLVPIVELFDKAVSLAALATHASKVEDLEYAYTGHARSAFLWLQCFLSNDKEREWCYTRGCPACVVEHSLDSEFAVRLLHTACLLSDVHYPFTIEGPTLPSFIFFLDSLQDALAHDTLYGPDFFEHAQPKAIATRNGIEELIHQCIELDLTVSQARTPSDPSSPLSSAPASPSLAPLGATPSSGLKVKRSKIARRQLRLQLEEEQWMEEMLRRCWTQLQPEVKEGLMPVPSQSLDAVLKGECTVQVTELEPGG